MKWWCWRVPVEEEHAAVLALLSDGESWGELALALALGMSQRSVQRGARRTGRNWQSAVIRARPFTPLDDSAAGRNHDDIVTPRHSWRND